MSDTASQQPRRNVVVVAVAVVVVALAVVLAVWLTRDSGDDDGDGSVAVPSGAPADPSSAPSAGTLTPSGEDVLRRAMSGQDAIDALGERLEWVAQLNGMSVDDLRDLLLRDATVTVAPSGRLMYDDQMTPPPTPE